MKLKSAFNKNSPIKQLFLEMKNFYPYGHLQYKDCECIIRFKKIFEYQHYEQTKKQIQRYCRLKHKNLLEILRAIQCQKNGYFEILYEYIHNGLESSLSKLKQQNIAAFKDQLVDLCKYLILNNINPKIQLDLMGFQHDKLIYFLSLQNSNFTQNLNKKQLIGLKMAQIDQFFSSLLKRKYINRKKSAKQFISAQTPQNFHNVSSNNLKNFHKTKKYRKSSLTNANSVGSAHSHKNMQSPTFDKIRSIDDKINELLLKMRKSSVKLSQIKNRSKQNNLLKKTFQQETKPINLNLKDKKSNTDQKPLNINLSPKHTLIINQQKNFKKPQLVSPKFNRCKNQITIHIPPSPPPAPAPKHFDEESIDTYVMELGQNAEMPKIVNPQMRQTTKSPPKLLFRQKMHQSVGNKLDEKLINELKIINQKLNQKSNKQKDKQHDISQFKQFEQKKSTNKTNENNNLKKKNFQSPQKIKPFHFQSPQKSKPLNQVRQKIIVSTNSADVIKNKYNNTYIVDQKNQSKYKITPEIFTNPNEKNKKNHQNPSTTLVKKQMMKSQNNGFNEILKNYQIKGQIVGDFNNLFESPNITTNNNEYRKKPRSASEQIRSEQSTQPIIQTLFKKRKNSQINERVKQALLKSEATLQTYKRLNNCKK